MYYRRGLQAIQIECSRIIPSPEEAAEYMLIGNNVRQGRITRGSLLLRVWWRRTR
jgi:hypothetical protein